MKCVAENARVRAILVCCAALGLGSSACGSADSVPPPAQVAMAGTGGAAIAVGTGGAAGPVGGKMATGGTTAPATGGTSAAGSGGGSKPPDEGTGGRVSVPVGSSDWAFIGYDIGSSYFNAGETVLTKDNAANLAEIWTKDLGGSVMGAPLQIGDIMYANGPGSVIAYDATTGTEMWNVRFSSTGSLAYADGKLYLHLTSGAVAALDAANGDMLWTKDPDPSEANDGSASPIIAGDTLLIGGANGGLELSSGAFRGYMAGMDRLTGDVLWLTYTVPETGHGASIWSSPSADLATGRAFGSTGNNYGTPASDTSDSFIAFDLKKGDIIWKAQKVMDDTFSLGSAAPDADFGANPVLYETMVAGKLTQLVGGGNKGGDAHAVRRDDGSKVWDRDLGPGYADGSQGVFVNSTWSGKNLLVACNETSTATLYALDGATGDIAWMRKLPGPVWGRISAVPGVGFVGTGQEFQVFDLDTGDMIKSFPSKGGTVAGTITISKGRVAFGEGFTWPTGGSSKSGSTLTVLGIK